MLLNDSALFFQICISFAHVVFRFIYSNRVLQIMNFHVRFDWILIFLFSLVFPLNCDVPSKDQLFPSLRQQQQHDEILHENLVFLQLFLPYSKLQRVILSISPYINFCGSLSPPLSKKNEWVSVSILDSALYFCVPATNTQCEYNWRIRNFPSNTKFTFFTLCHKINYYQISSFE